MAHVAEPLSVSIVTQTGTVFDGRATEVVAPGSDGQLGILPHHAALMTTLGIGALHIKHTAGEETLFIGGGFMEVYQDQITILADDAEHASQIDEAAAEAARRRAEQLLAQRTSETDVAALQAMIERSIGRIRVAEIQRTRRNRRELPTQQ